MPLGMRDLGQRQGGTLPGKGNMSNLEALAQDVRDKRAAYMRDGIKGGAAYRAYRAANATFAAALEAERKRLMTAPSYSRSNAIAD